MRWWTWLLLAWILLSIPAAVLLGLVIRAARNEDACAACRHGRVAHDHRRTDCALCDCPAYVRSRPQRRVRRLRGRADWRGIPIPRRSSG